MQNIRYLNEYEPALDLFILCLDNLILKVCCTLLYSLYYLLTNFWSLQNNFRNWNTGFFTGFFKHKAEKWTGFILGMWTICTKLFDKLHLNLCILILNVCRLRFRRENNPSGTRFSTMVIDKMVFFLNFVSNFQCNSMTDVVKFCTSGTLVKKWLITLIHSFIYWSPDWADKNDAKFYRACRPNFWDKWQKLTIYNHFCNQNHTCMR